MTDRCPTGFDETLLSGHLDGELTQAAGQRVQLHLEDCEHCRRLFGELAAMREAAMSTEFKNPDDRQWDERPQTRTSFALRGVGWLVVVLWAIGLSGFALWHLWQGTDNLGERVLVFGGLSGFALLFVSVLLDRVRTARTDRYREVEK
jgi:predicted anti-sigma-YlaC factor YlaD